MAPYDVLMDPESLPNHPVLDYKDINEDDDPLNEVCNLLIMAFFCIFIKKTPKLFMIKKNCTH